MIARKLEAPNAHARAEDGQTMAEYGVVLAMITIVTITVFTSLSDGLGRVLRAVAALLPV